MQLRDLDTFQTDRKQQDPKNGYLTVNAFRCQAKELLRLNLNWRLKDDSVR